jgi:hypothetical protein
MQKRNKYLIICMSVIISIAIPAKLLCFPSIPEMFRLNKQLQEEGYYMAEFEFKMLGTVYYLDRGNYWTAYSKLNELNNQLKSRKGLIKLPVFKNKKEEMAFYLDQQNPNTGAFMDDSYPFCTYASPTANILNKLDKLAQETGQPIKLKYRLKFLDEINTPEKLKEYLDDVSTVGWIGLKFPQNTFHFARCLFSLFYEDPIIDKYNLYEVSPEWRSAFLQWFYDRQDPETGLWGPRLKNGKLARKDTSNSANILKGFVDINGNDIHKDFPLRYRDQLAKSTLEEIDAIPGDTDLDEWHEWNLKTGKSITVLVRYLWNGLSDEMKAKTKDVVKNFIRVKFEKLYIEKEGAFSYYPGSEHATIEGSNVIGHFRDLGMLSKEKNEHLWGKSENNCTDNGKFYISEISESELIKKMDLTDVNSMRFYSAMPRNYTDGVLGVYYPKKTPVLDVMELVPKMKTWINSTAQSMGNWTSREEVAQRLSEIKIKPVPVSREELPLKELNNALKNNKKIILIGFDVLQIPRCKITFLLK